MTTPVNIVISGLPDTSVLCLKIGNVEHGIQTKQVEDAITCTTGIPSSSIFLRVGCSLLSNPSQYVCTPGMHTVFVWAALRRALPGGKGGFGSQLKGNGKKNGEKGSDSTGSTNFDACRDLQGRRIGAIRRERAVQNHGDQHQQDDIQKKCTSAVNVRKRSRVSSSDDGIDEINNENKNRQVEQQSQVVSDAMAQAVANGLQSDTNIIMNHRPDLDIQNSILKRENEHTHELDDEGVNSTKKRRTDCENDSYSIIDNYGSCSSGDEEIGV